jgi:hypothetical protein
MNAVLKMVSWLAMSASKRTVSSAFAMVQCQRRRKCMIYGKNQKNTFHDMTRTGMKREN